MRGKHLGALADRFQHANRRRKAKWLASFIAEHDVRSVLVVGSTGILGSRLWENEVERSLIAQCEQIVWSGIAGHGAEPYVVADGRALPFPDRSFDLVFSNAVIEHVGGEVEQRQFVAEHARVGRTWALTTPNLWFPVESHTRVVLWHWFPSWRSSRPEFTRLLSLRDLRQMATTVRGTPFSPTFIAFGSRRG